MFWEPPEVCGGRGIGAALGRANPPAGHASDEVPPSAESPPVDVEAFLREPRDALRAHYGGPVDSLTPVLLLDMRSEDPLPASKPTTPRRRIRRLVVAAGALGIGALILLAVQVIERQPNERAASLGPPAQSMRPKPAAGHPSPLPSTKQGDAVTSAMTPAPQPLPPAASIASAASPNVTAAISARRHGAARKTSQRSPPTARFPD